MLKTSVYKVAKDSKNELLHSNHSNPQKFRLPFFRYSFIEACVSQTWHCFLLATCWLGEKNALWRTQSFTAALLVILPLISKEQLNEGQSEYILTVVDTFCDKFINDFRLKRILSFLHELDGFSCFLENFFEKLEKIRFHLKSRLWSQKSALWTFWYYYITKFAMYYFCSALFTTAHIQVETSFSFGMIR